MEMGHLFGGAVLHCEEPSSDFGYKLHKMDNHKQQQQQQSAK